MENYFTELNNINVTDKVEQKNGLSYLSWAWAWGELKKKHPTANYTIYENKDGWNYFTDGTTAWVKTGVTVEGIEHIEYLPIMDNRNKSIPLPNISSFDVNKAIQRSLTKAVARHGLGLYIYAGEDLPEEENGLEAKKTIKDINAQETIKNATQGEKQAIGVKSQYQKLMTELARIGLDKNTALDQCKKMFGTNMVNEINDSQFQTLIMQLETVKQNPKSKLEDIPQINIVDHPF